MTNKLAVVLIRGTVNTHPDVRKTLELLRLKKKHTCVVIENNEISRGMVNKVKDYVTFGPINQETFKQLVEKRAMNVGEKAIDADSIAKKYFNETVKLRDFEDQFSIRPFFRLHPPKGGFEKGGIKTPFTNGGVLGKREQEQMQTLIGKML